MADLPISGLPAQSPVSTSALVPIVQGGATKQATVADILSAAGGGNVKADGSVPFTGAQSLGGNKLTSGAAATASDDFTIKSQVEALIAAAVAGVGGGGGDGWSFTFDTATGDADPTTDKLRFNNATIGSVTQIYVDLTDNFGNDLTAWLDRLDDSVGTVKGWLRVGSKSDKTKWALFQLTAVTSASGYRKLGVTGGFGTSLPTTTVADTFLSFESMGIIGTLPWSQLATAIGNLSFTGMKTLGYVQYDNGVSGAGTKAIDWNNGQVQKLQGNGNATLTFTAPSGAMGLQLLYVQDSTGSRTVTLPTIIWLDGVVWAPNPAHDAPTLLPLYYDGTNYYAYGRSLDSHVVVEPTGARIITIVDSGIYLRTTNAAGCSVTVPPNSSVAFPVDTLIAGEQASAGQVTFIQGVGVTINKPPSRNRKTSEQFSCWSLKKVGTDEWTLCGDLEFS
jgi:hypothetical protein